MTDDDAPLRLFCDAMLGGLARWLRAVGYDAAFEYGIDDGDLIDRAAADGRMILSSDGGLFERNVIKSGEIAALYIPQQLGRTDQLHFVVGELKLTRRHPRCMKCGGQLVEIPKHTVAAEAPPLAFRNCSHFWRCQQCAKLLWRGTHWQKIEARLSDLGLPDAFQP